MFETELLIQEHHVECIVGVWDHERITPQKLGLDVRLRFDATKASLSDDLNDTINYAGLVDAATFILKTGKFQLLETACHVLTHYFLAPHTAGEKRLSAQFAEVTLTKFDALPDQTLARVRMKANQADLDFEREEPAWGFVDVICETDDLGLYCLNVAPGQTLPLHHHARMEESELILDAGLLLLELDTEPKEIEPGTQFRWAYQHVHGYKNVTQQWARILCIDTPPFIPEDEVVWRAR